MSGDRGLDPHSDEVIKDLEVWASNMSEPDGQLGREVEHVPDSVAFRAAIRLAARLAAKRPDLFNRSIVMGHMEMMLDEYMPEGTVRA